MIIGEILSNWFSPKKEQKISWKSRRRCFIGFPSSFFYSTVTAVAAKYVWLYVWWWQSWINRRNKLNILMHTSCLYVCLYVCVRKTGKVKSTGSYVYSDFEKSMKLAKEIAFRKLVRRKNSKPVKLLSSPSYVLINPSAISFNTTVFENSLCLQNIYASICCRKSYLNHAFHNS
jgi:hypothetical protein